MVFQLDLSVDREDSLTGWRMVMRAERPTGCLYHISCVGWGCAHGDGLCPQWLIADISGALVLVWSLLAVLVAGFRWCFALCLFIILLVQFWLLGKSNRKAMNRNWSNQKANPPLKTKTGNK